MLKVQFFRKRFGKCGFSASVKSAQAYSASHALTPQGLFNYTIGSEKVNVVPAGPEDTP